MSVSVACPPDETCVEVEGDLDAAVALMTVRGAWSAPLRQLVTAALRGCLTEHPEALIVDLTALVDPGADSAGTWMAVRDAAAATDPAVHLALCIPPELPLADKMQRLGAGRYLPVYAKLRQARVAIVGRLSPTERLIMTLPPEPDSASLARNLAGDACLGWDLPELLHPARLLMSELVTNAVEHARTAITLGVSRRGAGIHLTVADGSAAQPVLLKLSRPRAGHPLDERGRGLRVVTATAAAWGSLPTRTGKVVWATLQPRATAPR
jgi:hypothetical protein